MLVKKKMLLLLAGTCFSVFNQAAYADGLADLKAALARLPAETTFNAVIEEKRRSSKGITLDEQSTQVNISLDGSPSGVKILYTKDLLARLANEERAKEKDPEAKTPTVDVIGEINSSELRAVISDVGNLPRVLKKARFTFENTKESFNGKPVRLLSFEMPIKKYNGKIRKYIKNYDGTLSVWIAADGTPLVTRINKVISGLLFVVNFEMENENDGAYDFAADRIFVIKKEAKGRRIGIGEKGQLGAARTLQVQS